MRPAALAIAVLAGICVATTASATGQITSWDGSGDQRSRALDVHVTIFGALTLPRGEFGATASDRAAFATPGAGLGLDYTCRYRHEIECGGALMIDHNPTDSGALGGSIAAVLRQFALPSDPFVVSTSGWTSAWSLAKLGYGPKLGGHLRVFADVYGGLLFVHKPTVELLAAPPGWLTGDVFGKGDWQVGPAWGAGGGVRWHEHITVGLRYLSSSVEPPQLRISTLHATLGYSFAL